MLITIEKVLFALLVIASGIAAYVTFSQMARTILRGQGEIRIDSAWRAMWSTLMAFIRQGGIIRRRRVTSLFHYAVSWGFIFYGLVNLLDIVDGYVSGFVFLGDGLAGGVYRFLADLFTFSVLIGVVYFLWRRFAAKDRQLSINDNVTVYPNAVKGIRRDSLIVGLFILFHVGFRFLGQSLLVASEGGDQWQIFANLVSNLWVGLPPEALNIGWHISWWIALGLILVFLPYFPYSKHAHLFMGPINISTRPKRNSLGTLEPLDFEDETIEQFGAARLTDLSQTQVLDAFACIMCNRCQDACPAYVTGKELSPAAIEINKRYYIRQQMPSLARGDADEAILLNYAISESALWACTTCGACIEVCPVGNEPMFDIMNIRQNQVLMESSFPQELKSAFNGMERLANPWGMSDDRMAWAQQLTFEVPSVEENPDFEVLYWVGCAGAFDPNAQEIARSMATILHSAGVSFAVLGNNESCTGDSARRAGNEYLFFELAQTNIENLKSIGADTKRIVTTCPHCFQTLGKEYQDFGGHFQVMHHTQFIADLVGKGILTLKNGNVLEKATFHDPCYLGRHNGVYDEPRQNLADAGYTLLEMERSKEGSFCCGAGGAQMWKEEEHGKEGVNTNRFAEARATGAKTLATGCPFCAIMMIDANKQAGDEMQVKDVAQIIADAIS
jgi:Fe-S oxidoreductase